MYVCGWVGREVGEHETAKVWEQDYIDRETAKWES